METIELKPQDEDDYNCLHDVLVNVFWDKNGDREYTKEEIEHYYEKLPKSIKLDAIKWGWSDTVVRDQAFEWIQKNEGTDGNTKRNTD